MGRACAAVCNIAAGSGFDVLAVREQFGAEGVVQLSIEALRKFGCGNGNGDGDSDGDGSGSAVAAHRALGALMYLCTDLVGNRRLAAFHGAGAVIVEALNTHLKDEDVQSRGLGCLWRMMAPMTASSSSSSSSTLSPRSSEDRAVAKQFAEVGACEAVVRALERFGDGSSGAKLGSNDGTFLARGLGALAGLCDGSAANRGRVARACGLGGSHNDYNNAYRMSGPMVLLPKLVVAALDKFPSDRGLQRNGLRCLGCLELDTSLASSSSPGAFLSPDVIKQCVRRAAGRFPGDADFETLAADAMRNATATAADTLLAPFSPKSSSFSSSSSTPLSSPSSSSRSSSFKSSSSSSSSSRGRVAEAGAGKGAPAPPPSKATNPNNSTNGTWNFGVFGFQGNAEEEKAVASHAASIEL